MIDSLVWRVECFEELDIHRLYALLHLRSDVFSVEQASAYLDLDNKDQLAVHVQGYVGNRLVAYCRLFRPGDYMTDACIGRVVVDRDFRGLNYGNLLMDKAVYLLEELFGERRITLSGQLYLQRFYESNGFVVVSDMYLEDGIPHLRMTKG